jgi:hypothetical protein
MSNKINDLANGVQITAGITAGVAITTTGVSGPALNFIQADGNCFAVQVVGTIIGVTATHSGKIQESPSTTAASFTDIPGATFPPVTTVGTSGPLGHHVPADAAVPAVRRRAGRGDVQRPGGRAHHGAEQATVKGLAWRTS